MKTQLAQQFTKVIQLVNKGTRVELSSSLLLSSGLQPLLCSASGYLDNQDVGKVTLLLEALGFNAFPPPLF